MYKFEIYSPTMNIKQQLTKSLIAFYDDKNIKYSKLTVSNHAIRLNKMFSLLNVEKDIFNISNISNVEMVMNVLKNKYPNITTLKSYVKSLAIFIQMIDNNNEYDNLLKSYRDSMLILNKKIDIRQKNIIKTKILSITQEDIMNLKLNYEKEINKYVIVPKMSIKSKHLFQRHLIFCLYSGLYIPPARNDFPIMKLTTNYEEEKDKQEYNFYDRVKKEFHFNKFKNSNEKGSVNYIIPDELAVIIENYLKVMGNSTVFLFTSISSGKTNGRQYQDCNFSQLIQKIFNGAGVSTLRKVYLTKKYEILYKTLRDLKNDTNMMMNTSNTALKHYIHENTKDL